jgi:hypothetical protein
MRLQSIFAADEIGVMASAKWPQEFPRTLWRVRYRYANKENMLALGACPEITLASARGPADASGRRTATKERHHLG